MIPTESGWYIAGPSESSPSWVKEDYPDSMPVYVYRFSENEEFFVYILNHEIVFNLSDWEFFDPLYHDGEHIKSAPLLLISDDND